MKSKRIRFAAKLVLCIGILAALLGCIGALLLSLDNPLGFDTNYVPDVMDFVYIGIGLLVFIIISIILSVIAAGVAKRERISQCFAEAEEPVAEEAPAEEAPVEEACEEENAEEIPVETVDDAAVTDETVETEEAAPEEEKSRIDTICDKIQEKTGLSDEQMETAKKVGKVAVPVIILGAAIGLVANYERLRKNEKRRENFYKWLG